MNTLEFSFPTFLREEFNDKLVSVNKKISRISGSTHIEVMAESYFESLVADVKCHFTKVQLSLPLNPKIAGFSLVGIITNEDQSKMIKSFTGENLSHLDWDKCDHCNTNRYRTRTYILKKDGEYKVIGSSCMQEYLGLDIDGILSKFLKFNKQVEEMTNFSRIKGNHIDEILEAVRILYSTDKFYVSRNRVEDMNDCTKGKVDYIVRLLPENRDVADPSVPSVEEIKALLIDTYSKMEANTNFNSNVVNTVFYVFNDTRVLRDVVLDSARGVFYWAVYNVLNKKEPVVVPTPQTAGGFLGDVGDVVEGKGTVVMAKEVVSEYGASRLVEIRDGHGNSIKTFTRSKVALDLDLNQTVSFKGTVKSQETFRGTKATMLTRVAFVK